MANVSIKFNGKEFLLSCEDGQEEHLEELLIQINQKFNELKNNLGNLGENKLLLMNDSFAKLIILNINKVNCYNTTTMVAVPQCSALEVSIPA